MLPDVVILAVGYRSSKMYEAHASVAVNAVSQLITAEVSVCSRARELPTAEKESATTPPPEFWQTTA